MIVDFQKFIELIPDLVKQAELEISGYGSGVQRRQFVIDEINKIVDVPFVPESVEGSIIGIMVDAVVTAFNKLFGKKWIDKVEAKP